MQAQCVESRGSRCSHDQIQDVGLSLLPIRGPGILATNGWIYNVVYGPAALDPLAIGNLLL
jgi:hypothetical protein